MSELTHEVPEALKKLTRFIVRGFYTIEHSIIIDFLVRNPCMKEDDLLELLKFERKQLRAILETLKADQFLKTRMRVETDAEGKTTKHNYYFINYKVFVNVVKYKLDHMRRKIETEERDSTSRASFKCPQCEKQYTDLEADQLFDFVTQQFMCMYCGAEVEEQIQATPKKDAITLVAKFNEQIEPLYVLLREVEDVKLAPEILEPEPTNVSHILNAKPKDRGAKDHSVWSGDLKRGINFGDTEASVKVEFGDDASKPKEIVLKERPIWMTESTVEGAQADAILSDVAKTSADDSKPSASKKQEMDDIMKTLMIHETKSNNPNLPNKPANTDSSDDEEPMSASNVKDESLESEDEEEVPMVSVGGAQVPFNEVTEEIVARMTPQEKELYIKLGQEMYNHMYDD